MALGFKGLGFRGLALGLNRFRGLGFRVSGFGFRDYGLGTWIAPKTSESMDDSCACGPGGHAEAGKIPRQLILHCTTGKALQDERKTLASKQEAWICPPPRHVNPKP